MYELPSTGAVAHIASIQEVPYTPHFPPSAFMTQALFKVIASHLSGKGIHPNPELSKVQDGKKL
jgi:hypothetical protein